MMEDCKFFCYDGKEYFGNTDGLAIQYLCFHWEDSTEIEFRTVRFALIAEFQIDEFEKKEIASLETACLKEISKVMNKHIRANIQGKRIEIYPEESLEKIRKDICEAMEPKAIFSTFSEKIIRFFA